MALLERLAILITADAAGAIDEMKKVASAAEKDLGKAGNEGSKLSTNMTKAGAAMMGAGAGLLAVGVASADTATSLGREVMKLQRYTGLTAEEASKLAYSAKMSGVPVDSLAIGLGRLSKAMEANSPVFDKLGISARDSDGKLRSMGDVLPELAEQFKSMPNGPEKTATALQLFGRSGMDLMPFLNKGRDGIAQLSKEAEKMGLVLSQDNIGQIKAHIQSQRELSAAFEGIKTQIGLSMIPVLDAFTNTFKGMPGPIKDVIGPITVFGGGALVAMGAIGMLVGQLKNLSGAFSAVTTFIQGANPLTLALVAVGAAVAVAAIAIAAFGNESKNNKGNVDAFTQSLKETGAAADKLTADHIAAELQSKKLSDAFRNSGVSADLLSAAVKSGDTNFKTYGDSITKYGYATKDAQTALSNADPAIKTFNQSLAASYANGSLTYKQFTDLQGVVGQLAYDYGTTKKKTDDLTSSSAALADKGSTLAQAEQAAATATTNHSEAAKALNDALHAALDPFFGMINASAQNEKAQRDAATATDKVRKAYEDLIAARNSGNEKEIAEKTKAMAEAQESYTSAQKAAVDSAIGYETALNTITLGLKSGNISYDEAKAKIDEMEKNHRISAETANYFRGRLYDLAVGIAAIPASASVKVTADTWDAAWKITDLVTRIETLNKLSHAPGNYNFSSITGTPGSAMGGRIGPGMAMGGRPGLPHLVGELGPEIFWPDTAGTIIPADTTSNMLAPSASGGNAIYNVTINTVAGDPIALERAVLDALGRAHVRGLTALKP